MKRVPQVKTTLCCSPCSGDNELDSEQDVREPIRPESVVRPNVTDMDPRFRRESVIPVATPTLLGFTDEQRPSFSSPTALTSTGGSGTPVALASVKTPFNKELFVVRENPEAMGKKRFAARLNIQPTDVRESSEGTPLRVPATIRPRNKIALRPGRSLMDWIRLGASGKDLSGVGGNLIDVTEEELAKHNYITDAWMCLRGNIYNVTPYMEYHPGGIDMLMKGAGKDATALFMEIHKWVNFESILQKCLVGRLVTFAAPLGTVEVDSKNNSQRPSRRSSIPGFLKPRVSLTADFLPVIRHDWYQSDSNIVIVVYTNLSEVTPENVIVDIHLNAELLISTYMREHVFQLHWELDAKVKFNTEVRVSGNGKVEVVLTKLLPGHWLVVGSPLGFHNNYTTEEKKELNYRPCTLIAKQSTSYNCALFTFELPEGCYMHVPVAKHISLKLGVEGVAVAHSYTPVPRMRLNSGSEDSHEQHMYLLVKVYPNGALTPVLDNLPIGSTVEISDYYGAFNTKKVDRCTQLCLLAAGSGLTPLISVAYHLLTVNKLATLSIKFVFFNKEERDILWREELENLSNEDKRFEVTYVLSKPDDSWTGLTGRIDAELLQRFVAPFSPTEDNSRHSFVCACGPTPFNNECERLLLQMDYPTSHFHIFKNE